MDLKHAKYMAIGAKSSNWSRNFEFHSSKSIRKYQTNCRTGREIIQYGVSQLVIYLASKLID
jgi:hypothetical protein